LAAEKWSKAGGAGLSVGLGGAAIGGFKGMTDTLVKLAAGANISGVDAGSFEKVIDDFAAFVGEKEFYLKVGNVLRTKSAILGHAAGAGESSVEHIEARERIDEKVEEVSDAYDHSFDIAIGDCVTVGKILEELAPIKQTVFDNAIADGNSPEDAWEIAEDFEEEVTALAEESEELRKQAEDAPGAPILAGKDDAAPSTPTEKASASQILPGKAPIAPGAPASPILSAVEADEDLPDLSPGLESVDFTLQMMSIDPLTPRTGTEVDLTRAFREIPAARIRMTPQEKVPAYEPKNVFEAKLKELTIFRHRIFDFVNRHPEAREMGMKLLHRGLQGWQGWLYAGAAIGGFAAGGPLGSAAAVSGMYAVQTAIEAGIDVAETAIDAKTSAVANSIAKKITADHVLQKEFASTIKTSEVVLLCAISPRALKIFGKTVKNQATALKRINPLKGKPGTARAAEYSKIKQSPHCDPKKERIQRSAEDVFNYVQKMKKEGWEFLGRNGEKRAYINRKTGEIRYNDNTHNEIECFDSSRRHSVRDPVTDELLDKPRHQFPDWLKRLL
jgi:hypothetical protein